MRSDNHGNSVLKANHFAPCAIDNSYDSGEVQEIEKGKKLKGGIRERLKSRVGSQRDKEIGFPQLDNANVSVDALDYFAFWGKSGESALGDTPQ